MKVTKIKVIRACIFSDSWIRGTNHSKNLWTEKTNFDVNCYRKILRIPWRNETSQKIQEHQNKEAELFWMFEKNMSFSWEILFETRLERKRRRERSARRLLDGISDWLWRGVTEVGRNPQKRTDFWHMIERATSRTADRPGWWWNQSKKKNVANI